MGTPADVVVVGAGVMGAAIAWRLALGGHRVDVLDRLEPGHALGSSHGPSRAFRLAHEDPDYALLATESLACWRELELLARTSLLRPLGTLEWGADAAPYRTTLGDCGVVWEDLDAAEVRRRFDVRLPRGELALWQPDGGVLAATRSVQTLVRLATEAGARFWYGVEVQALEGEVPARVATDNGYFTADVVVLAAGPWLPALARTAGLELPITVVRRHVAYLSLGRADLPVLIDGGEPPWSLIPRVFGGPGLRVGLPADEGASHVDPDEEAALPSARQIEEARLWLEARTAGTPEVVAVDPCLCATTPDRGFIIAREGPVVVVSACNGQGFKFAPRLARAVVELVEGGLPHLPGDLVGRWASAVRKEQLS